ncbi:MAG TPA: hypothetical protein VGO80_11945 [Solirubrobacteraceae bacterium]|nr:hypothetical protein [Solirubrobacteraceae bacterium]
MSESYAAEKLWAAVDMLAGDELPLRDRLVYAMIGALVRLEPGDFVDLEDRACFEAIMSTARGFEAIHDEGDIAASIHLLSMAKAEQLAVDIRTLQSRYPFPELD